MKYSFFFILALLFFACNPPEKKRIAQWPYGVKYEVFVLSFADSDGDGKGDFKGLTSKLDYLQDLEIGGIWLMPIMPSPSYHKYDVTNYKGIHPDYGTVDDFKKFVDEAHQRNIKVLVDLILNHTGSDHPWFQSAIKGKDSPYRNYYVWANKDSVKNQITKKETTLDSDNITQWHAVNGNEKDEHYYGFFWGGMPDLNFDNPKVKEEFVDIGKYWLKEMNVDGFRLDAAKYIFPTDRAKDNHAFWVWFREEMTKIKPDVYLVGEVWSKAEDVAPYLKGIPALFNFDLGYAITGMVQAGRDTINFVEQYKKIIDYYSQSSDEYIDATFLRNHDQNRILSELKNDEKKVRSAISVLMTLPGTPYIYYGEEIGMKGMKPDEYIREPFIWDENKNDKMQTRWENAKYSTDKEVIPLSKQRNDPNSLYNYYKKWISYRNRSPLLTYGKIETYNGIKSAEVVSFIRKKDNQQALVIHNISDVEVTLPISQSEFRKIDFSTNDALSFSSNEIKLPAHTTAILVNE